MDDRGTVKRNGREIAMVRSYLAMDYGGSSGRGILGHYDGEKLILEEVNRFPVFFVEINGICYWDTFMMLQNLKESLKTAGQKCRNKTELVSVGIDTWGTDYGLLDGQGNPIGTSVCERNTQGAGRKAVTEKIGEKVLYEKTGTHFLDGNTLFQLYERKLREDSGLEYAGTLLMLPDLLGYFLTGECFSEYSDAVTSMLLDVESETWNVDILEKLGLPADIYPKVIHGGEKSFSVKKELLEELHLKGINYTPVLSHDTASAIAAVPHVPGQAFCSSGTWSIMGVVTKEPPAKDRARQYNFASSKFGNSFYKTHRDFMGMWMITQCKREWEAEGRKYSWEEITDAAAKAEEFAAVIDVDRSEFFNVGNMHGKIERYLARTGQRMPQGMGALSRCIYESLALRYRRTARQLQEISGEKITSLCIVGGGSRNRFLNQLIADAVEVPVIAGPSEAACIGNILMQMKADGQIQTLEEGWKIAENSFEKEVFLPDGTQDWESYDRKYQSIKESVKEEGKL